MMLRSFVLFFVIITQSGAAQAEKTHRFRSKVGPSSASSKKSDFKSLEKPDGDYDRKTSSSFSSISPPNLVKNDDCLRRGKKFQSMKDMENYFFSDKTKMEIFQYCYDLIKKDCNKIAALVEIHQKKFLKGLSKKKTDDALYNLGHHFIRLAILVPSTYRMEIMMHLVRLPAKKADKIVLAAFNMSQGSCHSDIIIEKISEMLSKGLKEPVSIGKLQANPLYQSSRDS